MTFFPFFLVWLTAAGAMHVAKSEFQQGVAYRIEARLDEATNVLTARAKLTYSNNSRDQIDTLWVHQHLNAFRPNSAWARRELQFGEERFQAQSDEDYAFERFRSISIDGVSITPIYPGAPDSTVAGMPLPEALQPGHSVEVMIDWQARLSTTPRRQGRRGRQYDFAQWYPRIAVYDETGWQTQPLLPQGEFFGEFASYDVRLDLAEDQIIGATGVPVEGDPGWSRGRGPAAAGIQYQRDAYTAKPAEPLGFLTGEPATGRKRVRLRAEDVHHFAWSVSPDYKYEEGMLDDVVIRVLYWEADHDWDEGRVVERAIAALTWLEGTFGEYPYPQLTLLHRLDGGGTEFPMMVMNGGSSQGLITHEVTHQYAHAILANNEWRDAWLDEGLTSFLSSWFSEDHGQDPGWARTMESIASWPARAHAKPVATPAAEFETFQLYAAMSYTKPSVIFRMLREYLGPESFRKGLRTYYTDNKLSHVDENDLRAAFEQVSGRDLRWFFDQWLHSAATLDYRLGAIETRRQGDGWVTRVEIFRDGDAWMPAVLRVGEIDQLLDSHERRQEVEVKSAEEPGSVELDPDRVLLDTDWSNNRWQRSEN